jgi:hypothetical protein
MTTTAAQAKTYLDANLTPIIGGAGYAPGTAYWLDLAAESITTASDMGFVNVSVVAAEQ